MWILMCQKTDKKYILLSKKDYLVGRKDTDILILEDPSISRKHAIFQVSHCATNLRNPEEKSTVLLKDNNSKYGLFVNGRQVKVETFLNDGDVVTFGQLGSNFKLSYEPLIVMTSCLDSASKTELENNLLTLGGHILSEWRTNCTHLVMNEVKITVKAVCAMVSLKPLVLPSYFKDLVESDNTTRSLVLANYIPPIGEEMLQREKVVFDTVPERASLFKKKTFVFFSKKQYKKLHIAVTLGGGQVQLFDTDDPVNDEKLLHADTCIVQCESEIPALQKSFLKIEEELEKTYRRAIPESDIGLAVVYCSLEKFCNPNTKPDFMQPSQFPLQTLSQEIFVPETQPVSTPAFEECFSSQTSVAETIFPTQRQSVHNIDDDESTIEDDENLRKRFRKTSSDDSIRAPSPKQARVERASLNIESASTVELPIKPETMAEEETIDWDDADTQPLPSVTQEIMMATCEELPRQIPVGDAKQKITKPTNTSLIPFGFLPSKKSSSMMEPRKAVVDDDVFDNEIPAKLMKVVFAPLIRKHRANRNVEEASTSRNVSTNFKKFKKVHPNSARLPRIIGGNDLQVFQQRIGAREVNLWLNEEDDIGDMENNFFSSQQHKRTKRR